MTLGDALPGFAPIVVCNPEGIELYLLVCCEWRVRFDPTNPTQATQGKWKYVSTPHKLPETARHEVFGGFSMYVYIYILELPPNPAPVTTRIIPFLAGNPYKPPFVTVTGWGVDLMYIHPMGFCFKQCICCRIKAEIERSSLDHELFRTNSCLILCCFKT